MATTTPNFGWAVPTSTDLVKDGAIAIETLGDAIDASLVDLKGGTTGQVLSKTSNTDMDFTWVAADDTNAIQNAIVDAKGDLIAATAADTPARLAVGTNGKVLSAQSAESTGLKWVVPLGTLISDTTFTNVATQDFDSVFSSTYKSYRIILQYVYGTAGSTLYMQSRYGTSTQASGYFGSSFGQESSGTAYSIPSNNVSAIALEVLGINYAASVSADMFITGVGVSDTPRMTFNSVNGYYGKFGGGGGLTSVQREYTGFRLTASSGNIYGRVLIYGLGE